jgi:prolyl-tRNA editing enzyme YbaK/EbsC (Cys-tRNA(Pro) deacylase)
VTKKPPTTPATAAAQEAGIAFRVVEYETIVVNGGRRRLQLELSPQELLRATSGRTLPLT